jgi:signal transduction histidine kinase
MNASQEFSQRITDAQLATRRQFAEFIHGEIQGRLLYITSLIRQGKLEQPEEIAQHLDDLIEKSVRPLAHRIYPAEIAISVTSALDTLCGDAVHWSTSDSFAAIDIVGAKVGLNHSQRECIYFICLEGVNNALKHGEPGTAELTLDVKDDYVTIQVTNKVLPRLSAQHKPSRSNISFGLRTIESWVTRCNGNWQLTESDNLYTLSASVGLTHE